MILFVFWVWLMFCLLSLLFDFVFGCSFIFGGLRSDVTNMLIEIYLAPTKVLFFLKANR